MDPKEIIEQLQLLTQQFVASLQNQSTEQAIRDLQAAYLSKKGKVGELQTSLGQVEPSQRKEVGQAFNKAKQTIVQSVTEAIDGLVKRAEEAYLNAHFDVTLPGRAPAQGHMHPLSIVMYDIVDVFTSMGFDVAQGPEIETDEYNFAKLNFPDDHPARDMQDTLFIEEGKTLLRTHMSPVQIRSMLERPLPVQVVAPGAVFRRDDDPTHSPMFFQIEGLLVDKGIHFGHLKGVLNTFLYQIFGEDVQTRFRPSFFPFTEPSVEVDIQCIYCKGKGCRLCSQTGWIEILGAGMVDPNVLEGVGIDSEMYSGFAFGLGVDRVAMLKYEGITSIKLFYENDPRFLERFRR
ncbi:MAG: phenylalanine--tRNA ligase subunit alpha [Deltaproteobacteria bacterium]|nr:phenylalanine--tRNA ligase subunit alpha [Deltaproteobacteria bacterium]MBN2673450.1 phenylalanine--tRNA ligase subunit alpha [Deltaproteobacteria bacterium]